MLRLVLVQLGEDILAEAAIARRVGMAKLRWHVHPSARVLARGLLAERRGEAARGAPELGLALQIGQRVARPIDIAREDHLICGGGGGGGRARCAMSGASRVRCPGFE